jgi:chorismate mutase
MTQLPHLRQQIDALDTTFLKLVAKRFELAKQTRKLKRTISDIEREGELRHKWAEEAAALGLSDVFVLNLLNMILAESKRLQELDSSAIA